LDREIDPALHPCGHRHGNHPGRGDRGRHRVKSFGVARLVDHHRRGAGVAARLELPQALGRGDQQQRRAVTIDPVGVGNLAVEHRRVELPGLAAVSRHMDRPAGLASHAQGDQTRPIAMAAHEQRAIGVGAKHHRPGRAIVQASVQALVRRREPGAGLMRVTH
jgi:hypothetical protein